MLAVSFLKNGAGGRTRTGTPIRARDFKSLASTKFRHSGLLILNGFIAVFDHLLYYNSSRIVAQVQNIYTRTQTFRVMMSISHCH